MKKKILLVLCFFIIISLGSCKKPEPQPQGPNHGLVEDNEAHYLLFMIENVEVAKMLVVSTDTYESLEPYFPTIPQKEGYYSYWEEVDVYSTEQTKIIINAYYVKE